MKKILAIITGVITLFAMGTASVTANEYTVAQQISVLQGLDVMQGDPDGNFRLEDYVTRAEFAKMAVKISSVRNLVSASVLVSPFADVTYTHWAAPYVRLASSNKFVTGYSDGSFRPEQYVTYAEAVTVCLKLLGYTDQDFGAAWPYGQMNTGNNIGLTRNITGGQDAPLTRGGCVVLLNNLLDTKLKGSNGKYASVLDCQIIENMVLIATNAEDPTVNAGKIYTSAGTLKLGANVNTSYVGMRGDGIIRNGDELISFVPSQSANITKMVVYSTLGNTIVGYKDGNLTQVTVPMGTTAYKGSAVTTFANVQSGLAMGMVVTFTKDAKGNIEYISINEGATLQGPMIVRGSGWYSPYCSTLEGVTVVRDGKKALPSAIKENDVAYYLSELNMMFVYINKKTGIYDSASPNKDMPTSVTVSGITYQIEGADAFAALSSNGNIEYGDTVTLLLGKDGKVAGAVSASEISSTVCGYVVGSGKKMFTNEDNNEYSSYYIDIVTAQGEKTQYVLKENGSKYLNRIVKISFNNNIARVSVISGQNAVYGKVDSQNYKIGDSLVSPYVSILDVSTVSGGNTPLYKKIYLSRLDGATLSDDNILYCEKDSEGKISSIITLNASSDMYSYGMVVKKDNNTGAITLDIGGRSIFVSGSFTGISSGVPSRITYDGTKVSAIVPLNSVSTRAESITESTVTCGNKTYKLSDNVAVYRVRAGSSNYEYIPKNEITENFNSYSLSVYYDKSESIGGRVRVIVAVEK